MGKLDDDKLARLTASQKPKRTVVLTNLADVQPRRARWLWWPYLPLGKVVVVAGAPGHGKSQFAALIAGMASRGLLYPGDITEASRTLMMCAEDDLDTTVVPRLLAVNADVRLVDAINVTTEYPSGVTSRGLIRIPGDFEAIHTWARDHVDARLVVMDPVASFFGREHSTLFNQDVRDALGPLVAIAETYGLTIVVILHLNKSEAKDFTSRIAESHGFQALARSVLALGPDPDDPEGAQGSRKVIAVTKANLVRQAARFGLRCEVRSATLASFTPPIETSELALLGRCNVSADDLLMPAAERSTRLQAVEWLAEFVSDRWVLVSDVRKAALSDGFHWRTIERIRQDHGYQRAKQPGVKHGPWWIAATTTTTPLARAHTRDTPVTGGVGDVGGQQDDQDNQDRPYRVNRARAREGDQNGKREQDLDDYRHLRDRMLGEGDDDD